MKITYDKNTDTMTIVFRDSPIRESDEVADNVIADFDEHGEIVSLEILRASRTIADAEHVEYIRSA